MLTKSFSKHPTRTTLLVIITQAAITVALLAFLISLASCSVARREGTTSPCYMKQFKATKGPTRKSY